MAPRVVEALGAWRESGVHVGEGGLQVPGPWYLQPQLRHVRGTLGSSSTTLTFCCPTFCSQAKLKPHSLEPRSQEQPLLQPKQVPNSQPPSGTCCARTGPRTPGGCRVGGVLSRSESSTKGGPGPSPERVGQALEPLPPGSPISPSHTMY